MNFKCFFGLHKWEYDWESIKYAGVSNKSDIKYFMTKVRYCNECSKKQRNSYAGEQIGESKSWVRYDNLTASQRRDRMLNDLGI